MNLRSVVVCKSFFLVSFFPSAFFWWHLCLPVETHNVQIGALHCLHYLTHISVECIGKLGVDTRISNDTTTYYVTNVTVLRGGGGSDNMNNACQVTQSETEIVHIRILLHTRMLDILCIIMIHKEETNFKYKIKSVFFNLCRMLI